MKYGTYPRNPPGLSKGVGPVTASNVDAVVREIMSKPINTWMDELMRAKYGKPQAATRNLVPFSGNKMFPVVPRIRGLAASRILQLHPALRAYFFAKDVYEQYYQTSNTPPGWNMDGWDEILRCGADQSGPWPIAILSCGIVAQFDASFGQTYMDEWLGFIDAPRNNVFPYTQGNLGSTWRKNRPDAPIPSYSDGGPGNYLPYIDAPFGGVVPMSIPPGQFVNPTPAIPYELIPYRPLDDLPEGSSRGYEAPETESTRGEPPPMQRQPPGKKERERKLVAQTAVLRMLSLAYTSMTEFNDFVDAFFKALPAKYRKKKDVPKHLLGDIPSDARYGTKYGNWTPQARLWLLFKNWDKIDTNAAMENTIKEYFKDKLIGKMAKDGQVGLSNAIGWNGVGKSRSTPGGGFDSLDFKPGLGETWS